MLHSQDYEALLHEIKNTIAFLNSSFQLIEKQHPEAKDFRYWNDISYDLDHLKALFVELTNARSIEALNINPYDFSEFMNEIIHITNSYLSKDLHINFQIDPEIKTVYFDRSRIKTVILNLIKNAAEAMNYTGNIDISAYLEDNFLTLNVEDNGPGMSEDVSNNLFESRFTTKECGSGLGLLTSKKIIDAHGGEILCRSTPGKGTCLTFKIQITDQAYEAS